MKYGMITIAAAITIVFIVQIAVPAFTDNFVLVSSDVAARPWTLVTSIFLHASAEHLLGNMFALIVFGLLLEGIIGTKKFLLIFFATGIVASLASVPFYESSLGASGAIMGVIGALTAMRPKMMVWAFGVPMPMIAAAGVWLLLDIGGVFYPSNVANMAHIGGLISGAAIGIVMSARAPKQSKEDRQKLLRDEEVDKWEDEWF